MAIAPITPAEVAAGAAGAVPDFVLEAFNGLLAERARNGSAEIGQDEVVSRILDLSPETINRQDIFNNHWLDVESIYRAAGWGVVYDKPGYDEKHQPFFKFKKA